MGSGGGGCDGGRPGLLPAAGCVLPFAGGCDNEAGGDGDADVEVAEFAVEFSLIEVRDRMPAMAVINGGFRVPLCDCIGALIITAAGEIVGQLNMKGCSQDDLATGWQGRGKDDFDNVNILRVVFYPGELVVDAEFQPVHVSPLFGAGEIEVCLAIADPLFTEGGAVIFVGIGPAVNPNKGERIGRMVDVLNFYRTVEGMCGVVEGDVDGIIDLLLPVGGRWGRRIPCCRGGGG